MERRLMLSHAAPHPIANVAAQATLSPPFYTFGNELRETVGKTPGVTVGPLVEGADGNYTVDVHARTHAHAVALASVMGPTRTFGNVTVKVEVTGPGLAPVKGVIPTSARAVAKLEKAALSGNPLFKEVVVREITPVPGSAEAVFPVFTRSVVQFSDDNLADLYQNRNLVAAQAFADVLDPAPGAIAVNPSTAR